MSQLQDTLQQIKDPTVAEAKAQFEQLITDGKASSQAFIQSSAEQLEQWVLDVAQGKMGQDEFEELVASQSIVAKNFVLSQSLATQKRAEELTIKALKLAAKEIVPLLIAAV